jgi:acetylornithine deacetylase
MLSAARALLESGEDRIGLLFTVGEEQDSAGAALANARLAEPWRPRFVVVGEPTGNRFVRSSKGLLKGCLVATGRAGHSSTDVGPSAVHELVLCLHRLLHLDWGSDPRLGRASLNVGQVEGGVAPNVVAASAQARILLRLVGSPERAERMIREQLGEHVRLDLGSAAYGPIEYELPTLPEGSDPIDVSFGTDVPHLPRFGRPLLYGPGRIADAHSPQERVSKVSLMQACQDYERVARELFERIDAGVA